jgi:hypothetical protein
VAFRALPAGAWGWFAGGRLVSSHHEPYEAVLNAP